MNTSPQGFFRRDLLYIVQSDDPRGAQQFLCRDVACVPGTAREDGLRAFGWARYGLEGAWEGVVWGPAVWALGWVPLTPGSPEDLAMEPE